MKSILLLLSILFTGYVALAQVNEPKEITPQLEKKFQADIEKSIPAFKQKLVKKNFSSDQIEFAVDTFRIEELRAMRFDIDYSTMGMTVSMREMAASYDKLLNKYYNKLLKILKPEDKKALISAQKAWMAFRDAEEGLIAILTKDEYSGGGSMQSNIATSTFGALITKRTVEIFNYYDEIIKEN